jgi:hypothetical protein
MAYIFLSEFPSMIKAFKFGAKKYGNDRTLFPLNLKINISSATMCCLLEAYNSGSLIFSASIKFGKRNDFQTFIIPNFYHLKRC